MVRVQPLAGFLFVLAGSLSASQPGFYKTVYPYSVLPGGLAGVNIDQERFTDPVVMQAWAGVHGLSPAALRGGLYYIQYRRGDQVGWTKEPRRIAAGEPVMVDQNGSILRMRCGNGISSRPRLPLVPFVPPPAEVPETPTVTWVETPGIMPTPVQPVVPVLVSELPLLPQPQLPLDVPPIPETITPRHGGGLFIPPILPIWGGGRDTSIPIVPLTPVPIASPVPEPSTILMAAAGLLALFHWHARSRRARGSR